MLLGALLLVAACPLLAACQRSDAVPEPRLVRLAELVEPPYAEQELRVGDDWRPGLAPLVESSGVLERLYVVDDERRLEVAVELPPVGAGVRRELRISTREVLEAPVVRVVRELPPGTPAGRREVALAFAPEEVGKRLLVTYRWRDLPAGERWPELRAGPLAIAPDAELALAVATHGSGGGSFRVDFEDAGGERRTVLGATPAPAPGAWSDLRVGLETIAGRSGSFVFAFDGPIETIPLWGAPIVQPARAAMPSRPSFLLVSLDTLRADRTSVYGAKRDTTPRLAARARSAKVFERALAPAASTAPSHMTALTGVMPCVHGVRGLYFEERLPAKLETLGEALQDGGYRTVAITEDAYLGAAYDFTRGFDRFVEVRGEESAAAPIAERTFAEARRSLAGLRDEAPPFLLLVHTYQVHAPYLPPAGMVERVTGRPQDEATPEVDLYDAEALYLDGLLDGLLGQALAARPRRDLWVVVLSDHGEEFYEHGKIGHGHTAYEEMIRVPLLVWGPGVAPGRAGGIFGLIDLTPTILDVARLPALPQAWGRSFAPVLRGASPAGGRVLFFQSADDRSRARIEGATKLVWQRDSGRHERFDLAADPGELHGEAPTDAEAARAAFAPLVRHCEQGAARYPSPDDTGATTGDWDPERAERLRALGYFE